MVRLKSSTNFQKLISIACSFTSEQQHQWEKWIPLAECWYNTSYHIASKMTPYEVVYGKPPLVLLPYTPYSSPVQEIDMVLWNDIRFVTSYRTIFTWQEPAWNNRLINTVLSSIFKLVIWFFFICSITSNPPWKTEGIKHSLKDLWPISSSSKDWVCCL